MITIGWFAFFFLVAFEAGFISAALRSEKKKIFEFGYRRGYRDAKYGITPEFPVESDKSDRSDESENY